MRCGNSFSSQLFERNILIRAAYSENRCSRECDTSLSLSSPLSIKDTYNNNNKKTTKKGFEKRSEGTTNKLVFFKNLHIVCVNCIHSSIFDCDSVYVLWFFFFWLYKQESLHIGPLHHFYSYTMSQSGYVAYSDVNTRTHTQHTHAYTPQSRMQQHQIPSNLVLCKIFSSHSFDRRDVMQRAAFSIDRNDKKRAIIKRVLLASIIFVKLVRHA